MIFTAVISGSSPQITTVGEISAPSPSEVDESSLTLQQQRLIRSSLETTRILFWVDYNNFVASSERNTFQLAEAAVSQRGMTAVVWGPGWQGWDASQSAQNNLKRAFPCGTLDVVFAFATLPDGVAAYCSSDDLASMGPPPPADSSSSHSASASAVFARPTTHLSADQHLGVPHDPSPAQVHDCSTWRARWIAASDPVVRPVALKWPYGELTSRMGWDEVAPEPWGDSHLFTHDWHSVSKSDTGTWQGTLDTTIAALSDKRPIFVVDMPLPSTVSPKAHEDVPASAHVALFSDAHLLVAAAAAAAHRSRKQTMAYIPPCSSTCSGVQRVPWSDRKYSVTLVRSGRGPYTLIPVLRDALQAKLVKGPYRIIKELSNAANSPTGYSSEAEQLKAHGVADGVHARVFTGEAGAATDGHALAAKRAEYCNTLAQSKLVVVDGGPWRVFPRAMLDAAAVGAAVASDTPSMHHAGLLRHIVQLPISSSPSRVAAVLNGALRQTPQLQSMSRGLAAWVQLHASCPERLARAVDAAIAFAAGRRGPMMSHAEWRGHPCVSNGLAQGAAGNWTTNWSHRGCDCHDSEQQDGRWCAQGYGQFATDRLPQHLTDLSS